MHLYIANDDWIHEKWEICKRKLWYLIQSKLNRSSFGSMTHVVFQSKCRILKERRRYDYEEHISEFHSLNNDCIVLRFWIETYQKTVRRKYFVQQDNQIRFAFIFVIDIWPFRIIPKNHTNDVIVFDKTKFSFWFVASVGTCGVYFNPKGLGFSDENKISLIRFPFILAHRKWCCVNRKIIYLRLFIIIFIEFEANSEKHTRATTKNGNERFLNY